MSNTSARIIKDNYFRFWVSFFTFLVCSLLSIQSENSPLIWITLLFVTYSALFAVSHVVAKQNKAKEWLQYSLVAIDVTVITTAIYLSGGIKSPLYILYIVLFGLCIYHESLSQFVYAAVLSFLLYTGLLLWQGPNEGVYLYAVAGQLMIIGLLTGVLYGVLILMARERKSNEKLVSRSKTLAHIANVLSGSLSNSRDWVRKISEIIEQEIREDNLKCRLVLHKNSQPYLPPSGGKVGVQIPIMVGEILFGTMIVTQENKKPLSIQDQDFFSSVAQSLGLSLHRARLWEDFQNQLKKMEAALLLHSKEPTVQSTGKPGPVGPPNSWFNADGNFHTIDEMSDLVQLERGQWELKLESYSVDKLISTVVDDLKKSKSYSELDIRVVGPVHAIQPFKADWGKLKKVVENMIENAALANKKTPELVLYLNQGEKELTISLQDLKKEKPTTGNDVGSFYGDSLRPSNEDEQKTNVRLLYCKKVVEAHQGRFWIENDKGTGGEIFNMSIPFETQPEPQKFSHSGS